MDEVNQLLYPIFKTSVFKNVSDQLSVKGFNTSVFKSLIFNSFEGQIDTGKTINSLWKLASKLGVKILTGAEVVNMGKGNVTVSHGGQETNFSAFSVVLTTNAFTKKLVPDLQLDPGRGQVMITKPIKELKCKGTFHVDEGYFYFRNVGNRLLLGGGRNLDFEGEKTTEFGINPTIEKHLKEMLANDILPDLDFVVEHQWSGIMAFGNEKRPVLEWTDSQTLLAVRLGGMGMAIGTELGELASNLVIERINEKKE
ncbi:MAG: NAD(P)/FAD-dependent oxidoreductase, partial [Salibacteraceae bacterium]